MLTRLDGADQLGRLQNAPRQQQEDGAAGAHVVHRRDAVQLHAALALQQDLRGRSRHSWAD